MFLPISFLSALAGVGLAGVAALMPDTGVDGTAGAYLALAGAVGVAALIGLLLIPGFVPPSLRGPVVVFVLLVMVLTGFAAWFLMQNLLLAGIALAAVTLLGSRATANRRVVL